MFYMIRKQLPCLVTLILATWIALVTASTLSAQTMTLRELIETGKWPVEEKIHKSVDGQDLLLLVSKPDGWKASDKRPAMVWIHGGGFTGGHPKQFIPQMKYSAARGAVGFSIQYRLMKGPNTKKDKKLSDEENAAKAAAHFKTFLEGPSLQDLIDDCADAIRYIRKNADQLGVDPDKIIASGDSAGAYLVNALGTLVPEDARVNAAMPGSSISDLTIGFGGEYVKPPQGDQRTSFEEDPARLARAKALSPVFNVPADGPAFLVLNGERDWLKDEPKQFYEALKAKGLDCEFVSYPEGRHAFILAGYTATDEQITQALLDMDTFLVKRGFFEGPAPIKMP
jgi:acetyl esterase